MSITYVLVDENLDLLFEEMTEVFDSVQKLHDPERIIVHDIGATQMQVDAVVNVHVNTNQTETQQQSSFVDSMRPLIESWHKGNITTSQALSSAATVLSDHPAHQSVMNGTIWQHTRVIFDGTAIDVTLGNILGNANAEAAYWEALMTYATRVKTWRNGNS